MSNLIFNLRIGLWYFQIARDWPFIIIAQNKYLRGKLGEHGWIRLYTP